MKTQWWSIFSTQLPHLLQWWVRSGLSEGMAHLLHRRVVPSNFTSMHCFSRFLCRRKRAWHRLDCTKESVERTHLYKDAVNNITLVWNASPWIQCPCCTIEGKANTVNTVYNHPINNNTITKGIGLAHRGRRQSQQHTIHALVQLVDNFFLLHTRRRATHCARTRF